MSQPGTPTSPDLTELEAMEQFWEWWEATFGIVDCLECGLELQFSPYYCAHVLGKGAHPALRTDRENFVPLCGDHHKQMDQESLDQMSISTYIRRKRYGLRNKYYL